MATIALVKESILALKERTGSSVIAINKWLESEKEVRYPILSATSSATDDSNLCPVTAHQRRRFFALSRYSSQTYFAHTHSIQL